MTLQVSPKGLGWFQDARFGMFIHWGLYSIIGKQEWVMHTDAIPVDDYEKLVPQFNPTKFNADKWASIAADAGQKYIVITSRHHDGFSMYDTSLSPYKVTNTPFKRDPLRELADACARRNIKLGFYVSLLDWHHPAYRFRTESGMAWGDYVEFLHGQVRELCTQYGEVGCIWFDGDWPAHPIDDSNRYFEPGGSFEYEKLYHMIHTLQPDAVIENNRHKAPLPGEDLQGFEQDLPGDNTTGFNETQIFGLPIQVCMTINDHWGWSSDDQNTKSVRRLVHILVRSASVGANLLLNVGPTPEGEILPLQAERLHGVGRWLEHNGSSIYGTRAGVIPNTRETVSTRRDEVHYVHILDDFSDSISLLGVPQGITHAQLLTTGQELVVQRKGNDKFVSAGAEQTAVYIPPEARNLFNTVIELR